MTMLLACATAPRDSLSEAIDQATDLESRAPQAARAMPRVAQQTQQPQSAHGRRKSRGLAREGCSRPRPAAARRLFPVPRARRLDVQNISVIGTTCTFGD